MVVLDSDSTACSSDSFLGNVKDETLAFHPYVVCLPVEFKVED